MKNRGRWSERDVREEREREGRVDEVGQKEREELEGGIRRGVRD